MTVSERQASDRVCNRLHTIQLVLTSARHRSNQAVFPSRAARRRSSAASFGTSPAEAMAERKFLTPQRKWRGHLPVALPMHPGESQACPRASYSGLGQLGSRSRGLQPHSTVRSLSPQRPRRPSVCPAANYRLPTATSPAKLQTANHRLTDQPACRRSYYTCVHA